MDNNQSNIGDSGNKVPQPNSLEQQWNGLTLEQLRFRRGIALVRREVGRERIAGILNGVKTDVKQNGLRSFLFQPGTVKALRWTDYVLLGFNAFKLVTKLWRR